MTEQLLVRLALGLLALLAAAWLTTGLVASQLESEGQAVVDGVPKNPTRAEVDSAIEALRDARRLNADQEPAVNEALLLWQTDRLARARAVGERVVLDEPENVEGWFAVWVTSLSAGDRDRAAQALAKVRALDPLRANVLNRLDSRGSAGS